MKHLYFEFHNTQQYDSENEHLFSSEKIIKFKKNKVLEIFIFSAPGEHHSGDLIYYQLLNEGFIVREIYIKKLNNNFLHDLKEIIDNVYQTFEKESCLVVYNGRIYAGAILASFLIYSGLDIENALTNLERIAKNLIKKNNELIFIEKFYKIINENNLQNEKVEIPNNSKKNDKNICKSNLKEKDKTNDHIVNLFSSIRFKLVSIISFIVAISFIGMIFFASSMFKNDNIDRIKQNNHKISSLIALKVQSDFTELINKTKFLRSLINKKNNYIDVFWQDEKDFIFSAIAQSNQSSKTPYFLTQSINQKLLKEMGISNKELKIILKREGKELLKAQYGETIIINISYILKYPAIAMSIPIEKTNSLKATYLISYIKFDRFLKAFNKEGGITNLFMVNGSGDIIAHHNIERSIAGGSLINLEIVKKMLKSPIDNGQIKFFDENKMPFLGSFKKIGLGNCGVIATVNEKDALEVVYQIQRRNFITLTIVLTVVILIIFFFAKTLTTPIKKLVLATTLIKNGDYLVKIKKTSKDEIGVLTDSFIEMGKGLEEREKIKNAFGKFVNEDIANKVLKGGISLGGEKKEVAVFFSDIRSFTAISEKLNPEEVVEFLNEYLTKMVRCVNEKHGVVDKFIGDAVMAVWGAPLSTGNDTENAIDAALAMRTKLIEFNKNRGGDKKPIIKIGCAINSGPVLAGQIGSDEKMEYTVIGDTVNLASRIEALNKPFGTDILITHDSYFIVENVYEVVEMKKIKVKGKKDPLQIYAILSRKDDSYGPKSLEELKYILKNEITSNEISLDEEVKYEILD